MMMCVVRRVNTDTRTAASSETRSRMLVCECYLNQRAWRKEKLQSYILVH